MKYTANISEQDQQILEERFGDQLEDIYNLNPGQEWMYKTRKNNKAAFFLQMVLTAEMRIDPATLMERVNEVCRRRQALRFAYISSGLSQTYCVCLKNRTAEVKFVNLENTPEDDEDELADYAEADRRRGFDLENDPLLRIGIFKLETKDNYAIMISQPHINSDGTSLGILIKEIFIDYVLNVDTSGQVDDYEAYRQMGEYFQAVDTEKELDYWKQYLEGADEDISMPGKLINDDPFEEMVYIRTLPAKLEEKLEEAQKKYKTTTYNIMQEIWGLTLSRITGRQDILFGAISAGREAALYKTMNIPGGFVRVVPVRMRLNDDMKLSEISAALHKDFAISVLHSHCSIDDIMGALKRKSPLFNSIINCHNFAGSKKTAGTFKGLPGFKIISGNAYDNLSEDFSIYIRPTPDGTAIGIGYNRSAFASETIQLYMECYMKILNQILMAEEDLTVGQLEKFDRSLFDMPADMRECEVLKKTMILKKNPIFTGIYWDSLMELASVSELKNYRTLDRIFSEADTLNELSIVVSGRAFTSATAINGWINPIKCRKSGDILSAAGFFQLHKSGLNATAMTNNTLVMRIPADKLYEFARKHPRVMYRLLENVTDECIKYERMWING